jgi:putative glutamine amidotransferase
MKPLIGITASYGSDQKNVLSDSYVRAILRAGGMPVLLPKLLGSSAAPAAPQTLLEKLDGVLFSGGADVDPALFNGVPHPKVYGVDADRDRLEMELARAAAQTGRPFLAICRGIQIVNVAMGGTLYTDIPDQLPGALVHSHDWANERDREAHVVDIDPASKLADILGTARTGTNSFHHQGILKTAPGLKTIASTADGLTEAVELPGHPFGIGVQWHPEEMPEDAVMPLLFAAFVRACESRI